MKINEFSSNRPQSPNYPKGSPWHSRGQRQPPTGGNPLAVGYRIYPPKITQTTKKKAVWGVFFFFLNY
ncbi:MAG: hypothetical protein SPE50_02330, partial [Evtepia sp.]|nr:hypothetical protein [Evtepia sp.]